MRVTTCAVLGCLSAGVAAAQGAGPTLSSEGDWDLRRSETTSAAGPSCTLTPKSRSRIQIANDRLDVTGLPRNSIFNYQYRIDDNPVSNAMIPSAEMQKAGVVSLDGDALRDVLKGRRFSIRILDRWHEAITEDVSLDGLRDLHARMQELCR